MNLRKISLVFVFIMIIPGFVMAGYGDGDWAAEPEGMFSPTPVLSQSCVAVRVPLTSSQALEGIRWYHNDSATVFPKILVASGLNDIPPLYSDGMVVVENATGVEVGWSEVQFSQAVASETGTLYVIFQLPVNAEGVDVGQGPGFGYVTSESGSCVYLSSDGDGWARLVTDYQLLVDPVYTIREPGIVSLKSAVDDQDQSLATDDEVLIRRTELLLPYPNPFNPLTTVAFNLKTPGTATLNIYDVRGRFVRNLEDGHLESGRHDYIWLGRDRSGQRVASGVYFARLQADGQTLIKRMMLVK